MNAPSPENFLDNLNEIVKRFPPHEDKLKEMIDEATRLNCGFTVERGKPGTLRVSPFAPVNTVIVIDMELILSGLGAEKFKPSGLELFTNDDKFRMDQSYVQEEFRTRELGTWNSGRAYPPLTANSPSP